MAICAVVIRRTVGFGVVVTSIGVGVVERILVGSARAIVTTAIVIALQRCQLRNIGRKGKPQKHLRVGTGGGVGAAVAATGVGVGAGIGRHGYGWLQYCVWVLALTIGGLRIDKGRSYTKRVTMCLPSRQIPEGSLGSTLTRVSIVGKRMYQRKRACAWQGRGPPVYCLCVATCGLSGDKVEKSGV